MTASTHPARARLSMVIERQDKARGRPLTDREKLQNLAIALGLPRDHLLPESLRGLPPEPKPC